MSSAVLSYFRKLRGGLSRATWKGLISASVWQLANYVIPLTTFPYLARTLGVAGFGTIGIGAAIAAYALLLTDWGFALSGTQQVARERDNPAIINRIIWETIAAKAVLGAVSAGTMVLGALVLVDSHALRAVLIVATLNVLGAVFTVDWALRGVEALGKFATASVVGRLASVPLVFLLVRNSGDVVEATVATAAGGIVTAAITLVMARGLGILGRPRGSASGVLTHLNQGFHVFLSTAMTGLYTNGMTLMLSVVAGAQQVGLFVGADRIRRPAQSLMSPIAMVFYPRMSFLAKADPDKAHDTGIRILIIQGGGALVMAVALCVGAPFLVPVLLGPGFNDSITVLQILSWLILFMNVGNVLGLMIMLPFGMKREFTFCILGSTAVGLCAVAPLSAYAGANGAAIALVLSEAVATVAMYLVLIKRFAWLRPSFRKNV